MSLPSLTVFVDISVTVGTESVKPLILHYANRCSTQWHGIFILKMFPISEDVCILSFRNVVCSDGKSLHDCGVTVTASIGRSIAFPSA